MGLVFRREAGETWRDAVARRARSFGLEVEALESFDATEGSDEEKASAALHEWDLWGYEEVRATVVDCDVDLGGG